EKLASVPGATLHGSIIHPHGVSLSQRYVGDLGIVSNIDAYDSLRLLEAWGEETLFDHHVTLRIGFMAYDTEFAVNDTAALFVNSSFGIPTPLADDFATPSYPYSAPGVRLSILP